MGGALNLHSAINPPGVSEGKLYLQFTFTYKVITSGSLANKAMKFKVL
jgi:hypothetical protein